MLQLCSWRSNDVGPRDVGRASSRPLRRGNRAIRGAGGVSVESSFWRQGTPTSPQFSQFCRIISGRVASDQQRAQERKHAAPEPALPLPQHQESILRAVGRHRTHPPSASHTSPPLFVPVIYNRSRSPPAGPSLPLLSRWIRFFAPVSASSTSPELDPAIPSPSLLRRASSIRPASTACATQCLR